ncbi:leucine-rich repeat, cysteine-containing subtype protein [Tanacetum coccineum]
MEKLTLKGPPYIRTYHSDIRITPWIEQLALGFRYLKELHIDRLVVLDEDLETLARTRAKDLRSLKISMCEGIVEDGFGYIIGLNKRFLESLHVIGMGLFIMNEEEVLHSYTSGKKLLERFSGLIRDKKSELVGFQFPPNIRSLSIKDVSDTEYPIVLPLLNHIRKLKYVYFNLHYECRCLLFKRCPNLEDLCTDDVCGDRGLQVIGQFCKKLRKLTHTGLVTHVGLIALAKSCINLESLEVRLKDISNEAIRCLGTHLKNLRKFRMCLAKKDGTTDPPLDSGILAMLMGCRKLEKLDIILMLGCKHGGLTDVGLEYIGKYGTNLRSLSLTRMGNSNAGLVKLSKGCPKLRKLQLRDCPFSEQVVTSCVFNMPSLRYVWFDNYSDRDHIFLELTRPEFKL